MNTEIDSKMSPEEMSSHLTHSPHSSIISILRQFMRRRKAKSCLKKYLKLRLHRKRVERSDLCYVFNVHYIKNLLHTLIPYEELYNYISKNFREKYKSLKNCKYLENHNTEKLLYCSDIYYTHGQIDCGDFLSNHRALSSRRPKNSEYCGLFGFGTRGHAYHSCIGWCGSRDNPENEKCHNVKTREAIMIIVLAVKRWKNKILQKKRRLPLQNLHKALFDKYAHSSCADGAQSIQSGKKAITVLFNRRFAEIHIMSFL